MKRKNCCLIWTRDEMRPPPTSPRAYLGITKTKNKMIGIPRIDHDIYTTSQTKLIKNTTPQSSRNTNAVSIQLVSIKIPSLDFLGKKIAYLYKPEALAATASAASCPMTAASSGMVFTKFWISANGRKPQRPSKGVNAVCNRKECNRKVDEIFWKLSS